MSGILLQISLSQTVNCQVSSVLSLAWENNVKVRLSQNKIAYNWLVEITLQHVQTVGNILLWKEAASITNHGQKCLCKVKASMCGKIRSQAPKFTEYGEGSEAKRSCVRALSRICDDGVRYGPICMVTYSCKSGADLL